ncbi:DNA protecting protein DprA [Malonomonas rubra DSM 5091]|uniref:DNA protecting protein DprA n=1 Tax=Malonomonas rubra DSM 5091 TaxID=1122189 RepID=A0A1M6EZ90_MALRU|nr:DNA-processing protein DprA [Malonomonas rubra]SHI90699.1 DNA protecting protein DprA [Malonomonas rubra DSM 5091]
MDINQSALLRLHLTRGIGRVALFKLQHQFGSFTDALRASPVQLEHAGLSAKVISQIPAKNDRAFLSICDRLDKLQVRLISFWDAEYPPLLRHIHDPPALLYLRGQIPEQDCFAIVGSRRATPGGLQLTHKLAGDLAEYDICIVSGLARGVDSAAHRGAIDRNGKTIAVLGCGVDYIYPPENSCLYMEMAENQAIISEYAPSTQPLAGHFPGRNRIISGLSKGVLIVEAAEKSGSLITGDFALEQGRELFATPGAVQSPTSQGVNRLLKEGAQLVTEADDILQNLWPSRLTRKQRQQDNQFAKQLTGAALKLYQQLGHEPLHIDEIGRKCGLTPMEVSAILLDLELQGGVQMLPGNSYIRGQA